MRHCSELRTCFTASAALALLAGSALAQPRFPADRALELQVRLTEPILIHATKGGFSQGPVSSPLDCSDIRTHTDFIFENPPGTQNVNAQAGFGEGESAAASYTLPPSAFPVTVRRAEILFATAATVSTTTKWTVRIWQGSPGNGTIVHTESSDGTIIPHIVIAPPSNNALLSYQIDPNEPSQVVIANNGSNTFSVEFRIDDHNNQTQNPCTTPPPSGSNAFPATDTSGLAAPAKNWLFGLNCGLLGCPPNGGWTTFQNLSSFCRPTGDWIMRVEFEPTDCGTVMGACCLAGGFCQMLTAADCATQSGTYQGDGVQCGAANCSPNGACCFQGGGCTILNSVDCATIGGTFQGAGSQCNGSSCPTGACCLPSGQCLGPVTMADCTAQSGVFKGTGTDCGSANCPQPTGACCAPNGACLVMTQANCAVIPGVWAGPNTTCGTTNCQTLSCYANCDGSTSAPVLNVSDFGCFLTKFASGNSYANCDGSTNQPILNVSDFGCYLTKFAAGCP